MPASTHTRTGAQPLGAAPPHRAGAAPVARTANGRVRDLLFADITSGRLAPGERLAIAPLAKRYGTSATPIRVALQELQGEGLVTAEPHCGARVREIDEEYANNVYELRRAVAGVLLPRCVRFVSNSDIEHFEQLEVWLEQTIERGNVPEILHATRAFQRAVYSIARNPQALEVIERTWLLLDAMRSKYGYGPHRLEATVRCHRDLLRALKNRDAVAAVKAVQTSTEGAAADMRYLLEKEGARRAASNKTG